MPTALKKVIFPMSYETWNKFADLAQQLQIAQLAGDSTRYEYLKEQMLKLDGHPGELQDDEILVPVVEQTTTISISPLARS